MGAVLNGGDQTKYTRNTSVGLIYVIRMEK